jgi:hypothetical protein
MNCPTIAERAYTKPSTIDSSNAPKFYQVAARKSSTQSAQTLEKVRSTASAAVLAKCNM